MLCKSLSVDAHGAPCQVNTVQPGHILSNAELNALSDEAIAERDHNIPIGRMGRPEDVGNCVAFLCSP